MTTRIALIHAVTVAMQPIADAFARHWSEAELVNFLDDSLAVDRGTSREIPPPLFKRFADLVTYANGIGARGILFTCSAFGPAIEAAAAASACPVLKPNEAMFEAALDHGRTVGMLSTFEPSNASMEEELKDMATRRGREAMLRTITVPSAVAALRAGDAAAHNLLLAQAAQELADCEAIMLAQFSASRAEAEVRSRVSTPVLTAPNSAVQKLKRLLLH
jgi:Asp/Glu/hydantoin racemase